MTSTARPSVVLVGAPGAGKSTVGALVADRLGVALRDTDAEIESRTGSTVADLFIDAGEAHFRALEQETVLDSLSTADGVLALGGGAVTSARVRGALAGHRTVFLDVGVAEAARRVGLATARPLLLGNVRGQLKALLDARRPLYQEVAWRTVATDGRSAAEVADEVVSLLVGAG